MHFLFLKDETLNQLNSLWRLTLTHQDSFQDPHLAAPNNSKLLCHKLPRLSNPPGTLQWLHHSETQPRLPRLCSCEHVFEWTEHCWVNRFFRWSPGESIVDYLLATWPWVSKQPYPLRIIISIRKSVIYKRTKEGIKKGKIIDWRTTLNGQKGIISKSTKATPTSESLKAICLLPSCSTLTSGCLENLLSRRGWRGLQVCLRY